VLKFIAWKVTLLAIPEFAGGGAPALLQFSRQEWGTLKRTIDSGQLCPLFLIGDLWNPTAGDHQVLAYGYEESSDRTSDKIFVYDPNCPGNGQEIILNFTGNIENKLQSPPSCSFGPDNELRGFFCALYNWVSPPLAVGLSTGISASSNRVRGGDTIEFRFGAKHFGFHNSASICLAIEEKFLPEGANVTLIEQPNASPIDQGIARPFLYSTSIPINYPIGRHRYSAVARIADADIGKRTKVIPVKEPGTRTEIEIDVLPPAGGNWRDFGSFIKRVGDIWITPASKIAIINNVDGRLEVFVVGGDGRGGGNELYHKWQTTPNGEWVTDWETLGGIILGNPAVGQNADGRLEVFVRGDDNRVYHKWQTTPNGEWVTDWETLGGHITSDVAVSQNADGRLEVFVRGDDNRVYHKSQTTPNGEWVTDWETLGGITLGNPAVGQNADGRLEVFVRGDDNRVYHKWQSTPNGEWVTDWETLGGITLGNPAVGQNADGRLEVFVRGDDNRVYHKWQSTPNGGWTADWETLGGITLGNPAVGQNADGRLEVFIRANDDGIYHKWQSTPNNGWERNFLPFSFQISFNRDPVVGRNADGRLEVFGSNEGGQLYHIWQTSIGRW
jgi:acylphosphatase